MIRFVKWLGIGLLSLVGLAVLTVVAAGLLYQFREPPRTAGGLPAHSSVYVTMDDGARIAADVALPADLKAGEKIPVLIKGIPYWRAPALSFLGGAAVEFGLLFDFAEPDVAILNGHGYAVVTVDTRGTGASFGHQDIMFSEREVADFGRIIDWAAKQPWSNGRVGAYGFSYRGLLAVNMAALGRPALKAIAPTFEFPDLYLTARPGGVLSNRFVEMWGTQTGALNQGRFPFIPHGDVLIAGPKAVDADKDRSLVEQAIADHARNYHFADCVQSAPNRDSIVCNSGKSLTDISEIGRQSAIEKPGLPMFVIAGYFDANSAAQTLHRYSTFSNPQEVILAPLAHGGFMSTDPFSTAMSVPGLKYAEQTNEMARFFDRYLKADGKPGPNSLRYFVLNGGGWRDSTTWPPRGVEASDWYLAGSHALASARPSEAGSDVYNVNFTATSGIPSRYESPAALSRTTYPDRATADAKLLTYTSPPMASDVTVAGDPVAKLMLSTTTTDGEVIVYLEHVSPGGKVTYLSEGVLELAHRKVSTTKAPSSDSFHSYLAADRAPMTPGKIEPIEIALSPIAVAFHKGDRIRIAIAGADADNLERIPATGPETFTIARNPDAPSSIELPVIPGP